MAIRARGCSQFVQRDLSGSDPPVVRYGGKVYPEAVCSLTTSEWRRRRREGLEFQATHSDAGFVREACSRQRKPIRRSPTGNGLMTRAEETPRRQGVKTHAN